MFEIKVESNDSEIKNELENLFTFLKLTGKTNEILNEIIISLFYNESIDENKIKQIAFLQNN